MNIAREKGLPTRKTPSTRANSSSISVLNVMGQEESMNDRIVDFTLSATLVIILLAMSTGLIMLMAFGAVEFTRYLHGGC